MQLCEYENQTLEAFVVSSRFYAKFDCQVARQNFSLLATAHDCETDLFLLFLASANLAILWNEELWGKEGTKCNWGRITNAK